jgi:predicted nucleic acid-binding protein
MKVIVNATPLIALSKINQLELLHQLFDEVMIPESVYHEVVVKGANKVGSNDLVNAGWINVETVPSSTAINPLLLGLDPGELDVIQLGLLINPDWVIIDEKLGRRLAKVMGLSVKGTLGILLTGFYSGYLSKQETLNLVQNLVDNGIRLSPRVINSIKAELDKN